ncbi:MAG: Ldh family oxidoreductase [Planctomycetota bacterium]
MTQTDYVLPRDLHAELVQQAFARRGYTPEECADAARFCELAAWHGIKTHNVLKAVHLDDLFGSKVGGCVPGATIERLPQRFKAIERWNANKKLGQSCAFAAMDRCMELADEFGVGIVSMDNAFHYLWGGGYVIDAAKKGYIAYTCCTSGTSEVVPFMGKTPTMGTNPHSWAFPTTEQLGYPICIDWATSAVAMGRVQQYIREGKELPPNAAVDEAGNPTTDPNRAKSLLFFGGHKGYGLGLINELLAAYTGCGIPSLRGVHGAGDPDEKRTPNFYFQCIRPDAFSCEDFPKGRDQNANVGAVLADIRQPGNEHCLFPGQIEAEAAARSAANDGLLFTPKEVDELAQIAAEAGVAFDRDTLRRATA